MSNNLKHTVLNSISLTEKPNDEYYISDELKLLYPYYFKGTSKTIRKIIERKNIPITEYIYATTFKKQWKICDKTCKKGKLLLTKKWVDNNIKEKNKDERLNNKDERVNNKDSNYEFFLKIDDICPYKSGYNGENYASLEQSVLSNRSMCSSRIIYDSNNDSSFEYNEKDVYEPNIVLNNNYLVNEMISERKYDEPNIVLNNDYLVNEMISERKHDEFNDDVYKFFKKNFRNFIHHLGINRNYQKKIEKIEQLNNNYKKNELKKDSEIKKIQKEKEKYKEMYEFLLKEKENKETIYNLQIKNLNLQVENLKLHLEFNIKSIK